jgi:hypothetical protein
MAQTQRTHSLGLGCRHESFKNWWGSHAELQSILQRMLWRNPVSALTSPLDVASGMTDSISVVDARNGAVLSKLTILKEEPYPGLQVRAKSSLGAATSSLVDPKSSLSDARTR